MYQRTDGENAKRGLREVICTVTLPKKSYTLIRQSFHFAKALRLLLWHRTQLNWTETWNHKGARTRARRFFFLPCEMEEVVADGQTLGKLMCISGVHLSMSISFLYLVIAVHSIRVQRCAKPHQTLTQGNKKHKQFTVPAKQLKSAITA